MRKLRVVGKIYEMKYSWKGHKDRKRHKNRIKRSGQTRLVYVWHKVWHPHHAKVTLGDSKVESIESIQFWWPSPPLPHHHIRGLCQNVDVLSDRGRLSIYLDLKVSTSLSLSLSLWRITTVTTATSPATVSIHNIIIIIINNSVIFIIYNNTK